MPHPRVDAGVPKPLHGLRPLSVILLALLIGGCALPRLSRERAPAEATEHPVRVAAVQYAHATESQSAGNTLEVYLENRGRRPVRFAGAALDGRELPDPDAVEFERLAGLFALRLHAGEQNNALLEAPLPAYKDKRILWWQFYPEATLQPGATILCQVNFAKRPRHARELVLREQDGRTHTVKIPAFHQPSRRIRAVTWRKDYGRMFVQYAADGAEPVSIRINGHAVADFIRLRPARAGLPEVLAFAPPVPPGRGDPLALALRFADGTERRALVRASSGILLDAPHGWQHDRTLPEPLRAEYRLDADPAVAYLPFDVACGDTRAGQHGAAAPSVVHARAAAYRRRPDQLTGVEFCTAIYSSIWNIYGPLADAVFIKPYQLHWGPDATRFIEHEEARIVTAREAAAPRPVIWVPERFKRARHIEAEELRVMAWMALADGVKGIRYHFWMNDIEEPFRECPGLGEEMKALNADIRRLEPVLGPLVPVESRFDRRQGVKVYESWSGDAGILLLVRNMNYRTDPRANDNGRSPRFRAEPRENVTVALDLPPWLAQAGEVIDPISGESLMHTVAADRRLNIALPRLEASRLVWILPAE